MLTPVDQKSNVICLGIVSILDQFLRFCRRVSIISIERAIAWLLSRCTCLHACQASLIVMLYTYIAIIGSCS
jgi:hypothetical protein